MPICCRECCAHSRYSLLMWQEGQHSATALKAAKHALRNQRGHKIVDGPTTKLRQLSRISVQAGRSNEQFACTAAPTCSVHASTYIFSSKGARSSTVLRATSIAQRRLQQMSATCAPLRQLLAHMRAALAHACERGPCSHFAKYQQRIGQEGVCVC
jgi:hypothetical protein